MTSNTLLPARRVFPFESARRSWLLTIILSLATLVLTATAWGTPPNLMGPTLLPGDVTLDASGAHEEKPFVAGGGDGFLAVWSDGRTNFLAPPPFPEDQGARDVYAARLDAGGALVDAIPIVVSQDFGYQVNPQASWNGENWLVVWESQAPTQYYYASAVFAARIAPDGTLLDQQPIPVVHYQNSNGLMLSVTSDGSNWLIVVQGTSAGENDLVGVRLAPNGVVMDTTPVVLAPAQYYLLFNITAHYAGGEFLVSYDAINDPRARRYTTNLTPIGGQFPMRGHLAKSNGTGYFVAWGANGNFVGSPMTKEGTLAFPAGVLLAPIGGADESDLAWDGAMWWFSLRDPNLGVTARRITAGGTLLDAVGILLDPSAGQDVRAHRIAGAAVPGAGGIVAIWQDYRAGGVNPCDIDAAFASPAGTPIPKGPIALSAPAQINSDISEGSNGFLIAYESRVSGNTRILGQRLSPSGLAIDTEPLFLGSGLLAGSPAVGWNGAMYLVAWSDATTILGVRVLPDGTVLDPTPISIMPGLTPDVAAIGDDFVVVGTHTPTNPHFRFPFSCRVDGPTGAVLDAPPRQLGQYFAQMTRVIRVGSRWLAMWQRNMSHDDPIAEISGAFIEIDGTSTPEFRSTVFLGNGYTPDLAFSGSVALVVYRTGLGTQDLKGLRILPDGTFPGGTGGFVISSAADQQFNPAVAWTGTEFLAAWDDRRNAVSFYDERTDVYGARVSEGGVLLDPSGFAIASTVLPEQHPAIASQADGWTVLGLSHFRSGGPFASYRVGMYVLPNAVVGVPVGPEGVDAATPAIAWTTVPNPFRPGAEIVYTLREPAALSLRIYDLTGRLVTTLIEGASSVAGENRAAWSGRDARGHEVASGVYFARIDTGRTSDTARFAFIR